MLTFSPDAILARTGPISERGRLANPVYPLASADARLLRQRRTEEVSEAQVRARAKAPIRGTVLAGQFPTLEDKPWQFQGEAPYLTNPSLNARPTLLKGLEAALARPRHLLH
jgi:hypothetical protein